MAEQEQDKNSLTGYQADRQSFIACAHLNSFVYVFHQSLQSHIGVIIYGVPLGYHTEFQIYI